MGWFHDAGGWWLWAVMPVVMVVVWGVLFWVLLSFFAESPRRAGDSPPDTDPEHVLAERYARGEIDSEEYRARLETVQQLTGSSHRRSATKARL